MILRNSTRRCEEAKTGRKNDNFNDPGEPESNRSLDLLIAEAYLMHPIRSIDLLLRQEIATECQAARPAAATV